MKMIYAIPLLLALAVVAVAGVFCATSSASASSGNTISGVVLVNTGDESSASVQRDVATWGNHDNETVTDFSDDDKYSIRVDIADGQSVGSVCMLLIGPDGYRRHKTEGAAPYALFGDSYRPAPQILYGRTLDEGDYDFSATAYAGKRCKGSSLQTVSVDFTLRRP